MLAEHFWKPNSRFEHNEVAVSAFQQWQCEMGHVLGGPSQLSACDIMTTLIS
jgi:hypothetical protein